jgi:murein DD-endopeptidase MepM/ murein hydrolase activator NlpD
MPIGQWDQEVPAGNSISIQTHNGLFVVLAHLKADSVLVDEGDEVAAGEPIARCGNSGVSNQPHVRLQIQNRPLPYDPDPQLRTFPIRFVHAERVRSELSSAGPFSVRRNDLIRPLPVTPSR